VSGVELLGIAIQEHSHLIAAVYVQEYRGRSTAWLGRQHGQPLFAIVQPFLQDHPAATVQFDWHI